MMRMDIVFVVDISGSPENLYGTAMMFIREIVHGVEFRSDTARVALVTYSGEATTLFYLNKHTDKNTILDAMSFPRSGGNTNMQEALRKADNDVFNSRNGDRSSVPNRVILLTDGCSDVQSANTVPMANNLKGNRDTTVHVVAIGDRVDLQEAAQVATSDQEPYLIKMKDSKDVTVGAQKLLDHMCRR